MTTEHEIDLITEAVNAHGIFFKRAVRAELQKVPRLKVIGEEYPVAYMEGASLDLLVEHDLGNQTYILPIECKRAYVQNKRWIFFEDPERKSKFLYSFKQANANVSGIEPISRKVLTVCVEGIEIDLAKAGKAGQGVYKSGNVDTIWKAGFQVCKGGIGFLREEFQSRRAYQAPYRDFCSFLLVVTSAPLSVCPLENQVVDPLTGRHIGPLVLTEKKWVLLRYPFTPASQAGAHSFYVNEAGYADPATRGLRAKEGVIILNVAHISDFFSTYFDWIRGD
jgi:hypothetical protein